MTYSKEYWEKLKDFADHPSQKAKIELVLQHGSVEAASMASGMNTRNFRRSISALKSRAAAAGITESMDLTTGVLAGQPISGASVYGKIGEDGTFQPTAAWVKGKASGEQDREQFLADLEDTLKGYKRLPRVKAPRKVLKDLMCVYPMGDPHIGMYSWHKETGSDFDCDIAEGQLRGAMQTLVAKTPDAEVGVILNLGDFFHSDNQQNRTQRGQNALDVDGRYARVLQIGVTLMVDCINMALEKHKRVLVRNNPGNHDPHSAQMLSVCLQWAFRHNPRVELVDIESPFWCYEFGRNMIATTHGDMVKPKDMAKLVANYWPEQWGRTEHRYCYLGHFHHEDKTEDGGLMVEIFNTLAAQDAWHHASGYKSRRNMKAIVLDKEYGEVERHTYSINRARS